MADGDHKGELEDSPAIIALGSLLKLTEIHFWVDLYTGMPYDSTYLECKETAMDEAISSSKTESSSVSVETELSRQMNELGLPLSFCTNKEKRNGKVRGNRKYVNKKVLHTHEETRDEASLKDDMQMEATPEHVNGGTCSDMIVDDKRENPKDERIDDTIDSGRNDESGDWMIYWDEFYERNYYYNSRTHESTWEQPPEMAYLDSVYVLNEMKEMVFKIDDEAYAIKNDIKEENSGVLQHDCRLSTTLSDDKLNELLSSKEDDGNMHLTPKKLYTEADDVVYKRKKKVKRTKAHKKSSVDNKEVEFEVSMDPIISKYWCQRYLLFSKYDEGIKMDEEGWFSATPECIARHHAFRCRNGIIVDCFTGVGGNAIRFASNIHTIAIDIDPKKIEYAQHNASIYGVKHLIEFITGDSFILAQNLKADTVFLSPPWGGPHYAKARNFDIITMLKPHNGQFLFNVAKQIAPRIVMFLPRNVDINQLAELSLSVNPPWKLEVEKNFLNGNLKAITAYFTDPSL
ncbi:uncharacterized protein LOC111911430 isoform X2 [Lactuca sativa]|uniref:uncharacterized protein LOC111911430 isoform X2 n=1 Tax=Lactuca sativa TaxID=4236 RepID=UPI000CD9EB36|nr:uncharacterized protein LOC111911430 isoform X2 [Lactuca sativa]